MVQRGEHFLEGHGAILGRFTQAVRRSDHLSGPHSAAGQQRTGDARPVVAARVLVDLGRASKLTPHDHGHVAVHASFMQVGDKRRDGPVEHRHVLPSTREVAAVPVPAAEVERHDASARFDQSTGDQEVFGHLRSTIGAERRIALAIARHVLGILVRQVHRGSQIG